eukprot:2515859-Prymnesium_polylepis.2
MALKTTAKTQKPVSVISHGSPSSVLSTALLANKAMAAATRRSCTDVLQIVSAYVCEKIIECVRDEGERCGAHRSKGLEDEPMAEAACAAIRRGHAWRQSSGPGLARRVSTIVL